MEKITEKSKEQQVFTETTRDDSWENLEKTLEQLSCRVKNLAKKNGFSKKLKDKVEFELI